MIGHRSLYAVIFLFYGILLCNSQDTIPGVGLNSVFDFGAKGDGISDDTEAIQKAIDSGVGQIVFLTGDYRLTKSVEIDLDRSGPISLIGSGTARIIMNGAGPAFSLIGNHMGTAGPSTIKQNIWSNQRMPLVDGLEIVGKHPEAVGIEATCTFQLTITRVLIREVLHAIHLTNRNRNVIISECHLFNNNGIGVYLDDVDLHQINITNCHISHNRGGGIVVRKGSVRNLQIGSCDIEGNMDVDYPPTANILIDITEGSMREGAIIGCTVQHGHYAPGSANIRFIGHGTETRHKSGYFTIADNIISDTQQNLHIKFGRGIIITGNAFGEGFPYNILVEHSDHIVFGTNILDRNPDYGTRSNNNVLMRDSHNITINGFHLNNNSGGPAGIVLERCSNYNLMNSTLLNCDEGGILLKDSENGKVSGNFIYNERSDVINHMAIKVLGGKNNLVINNYTNGVIEDESGTARIVNNQAF